MDAFNLFSISEVCCDKKHYLPLLLIGDESETMIDRYLDCGRLYVGTLGGEPIAVCVTVDTDENTTEVKNLAVRPEFQHRGFGRRMLEYVEKLCRRRTITLGTGETPSTLRFYQSCGYTFSHRIPDFFTDNYPHPIIEEGVMLRDMVYLKKDAAG